jgi:PPP family 3-phenylpropionic acid transporter
MANSPDKRVPYARLSAFYLFYFSTLGALIPYWSLYLKSLDFSPAQIGELMAILMVTKVIAPNLWAWLADRRGSRLPIVRSAALLAALSFLGVYLGSSYWWLALVMFSFSFFWNASLPQFEALTLNYLGERPQHYTRIRLWGSIGFIAAVIALGRLLDVHDMTLVPHAVAPLMVGIWLSTLLVVDVPQNTSASSHPPLHRVLRRSEVWRLLAVCFLMQMSHGPFYTFFSIYLEGYDYTRSQIGQLWALGVMAEVVMFVFMHRLVERYGLHTLFLSSFVLTSLRWVLVALAPENGLLLAFAQTLHAASFGIYHGVAIQLIHRFFVGPHQGRGQGLYSSISFGAGGAVGTLASGYLWDAAGPQSTFLLAAGVSALAALLAWEPMGSRGNEDPALP